MKLQRSLLIALAGALAFALTGCVGFHSRQNHRSSGIADFLYPKQDRPVVAPQMPVLELPLKVGIAFAPAENRFSSSVSTVQNEQILEKVAEAFRSQVFVKSIEVIPSGYLRAKGSFDNLDQVRRMMDIDVVVLVSYDQVQFTEENLLSLTYWTIVGAYIFQGNKNDTHTMIEAVVYDIPSRSLLFRAPGVNQMKSSATHMGLAEKRREDSAKSLALAMDDMTVNLGQRLGSFKEQVKQGKAKVEIRHSEGYTGAGSADAVLALILAAAGGLAWIRRNR